MTFSFTTVTPKTEFRKFFYYVREVEDGLDVLNRIAAGEDTLVKVELIDNNKRTSLPVEAFDGECFSEPIQRLKEEWRQILSQPVNVKSIHNQRISILLRRQHASTESHITTLERAISKTECSLTQIQDSTLDMPYNSMLLNRYKVILKLYQRHLATAQTRQKVYLARLIQLDT